MLRKLPLLVVSVTLVAGAGIAFAATNVHTSHANCLDTLWRTTPVSTSSTTFTEVPGLADSPSSIFAMTVAVSAQVSGAPVEFRVRSTNVGDQTVTSKPGRVRFVPDATGDAFSFQWVERGNQAAVHVIDLALEWRSPSGTQVTLDRGDMAVNYQTEAGSCVAA
jgi:hypothetical protein